MKSKMEKIILNINFINPGDEFTISTDKSAYIYYIYSSILYIAAIFGIISFFWS